MRVISEMRLSAFQFWSGGKDNASMLDYDELDEVGYMLDDIYSEGVEDVFINDLFWFDFAVVCDWLGYIYDEENNAVIRERNEEIEED